MKTINPMLGMLIRKAPIACIKCYKDRQVVATNTTAKTEQEVMAVLDSWVEKYGQVDYGFIYE